MDKSSFASKFLSRLGRIDAPQIEAFVATLVREKEFHRFIFDALQEGILVVDGGGRVLFGNEAARGLLGLGGGRRLEGEALEEVLRARRLRELAAEYRQHGRPIEQRMLRVRTPKGRVYAVSVLPVAPRDGDDPAEDGGPGAALWVIADQTEAQRRETERRQAESLRSLATLMAGIAHEIKNPLNSLNIHAQLIAQSLGDLRGGFAPAEEEAERLGRSTEVLLEETARLARILDQFIKAVRPSSLNLQRARMNEVVEAVAELLRPECERRRIDLVLDLDAENPALSLDPEQAKQAVLNLAKNALEAIDKPAGRIVLRTVLRGDHLVVEVEDNGCGIAEDDRLRIFEPYHTTKFEGTGLGLMIVFRIVTAHGGEIGLDSELGEGATFRLAFPLHERPVRLLADEGAGLHPFPEGAAEADSEQVWAEAERLAAEPPEDGKPRQNG